MDGIDARVRQFVYRRFLEAGVPPSPAEAGEATGTTAGEAEASYRRLAEGRALVLRSGTAQILMAPPFSADPTRFQVEAGGRVYRANCMWDALGFPALLGGDVRITAGCGDCGEPMLVEVRRGTLAAGEGIVHVGVPAGRWWRDIEFT